jgi:NTE family protein
MLRKFAWGHLSRAVVILMLAALAGCATRPVNPPIAHADDTKGYRFENRKPRGVNNENLVILAFSGGGMRAAAFSYGVLEFLAKTEVKGAQGNTVRLIDEVDVITGVSGGSFTALAYGLYGDKLFQEYEQRFLKRDVQGELIARFFSPRNWGDLWSLGWGRSELAATLYDDILFNGATFKDLDQGNGPMILTTATDISTGSRFQFTQRYFDQICSDVNAVSLSRAAAASSAVPVILSPLTFNNYGGTCQNKTPSWMLPFADLENPSRPAARAVRALQNERAFSDSKNRPYLHLVDGGVSDNIGMRGVLESLDIIQALAGTGVPTPLDKAKRIIVFIVNSLSTPKTNWDKSETPPSTLNVLLKAAGTPIDHFSFEAVEQLKDMSAQWDNLTLIRNSAALKANKDPKVAAAVRGPSAEIFVVDVSFPKLKNEAERDYLNQQPTSFVLPDEAVDRLRHAAGQIIIESSDFQTLLQSLRADIVTSAADKK